MQEVIARRRDGGKHSREEIEFIAKVAADGSVPDYQLAAWLMAAYLNPLSDEETALLTLAMANSGERIDLTGLPKPWVDKHSTGGVGDKTSIVLLPLLASCGLTMVKMSGRGLGITGGTIDKLSSLPGFRVDLSPEEMKTQAAKIGLAITGASPSLAPADKALYALRDATATVRSMPLIVSSILSKKIAGGAEIVVLDVKCGYGAFMKTLDEARRLAELLKKTAELAGLKTRIAITDMDQPLGASVGNLLEVLEAMGVLHPLPANGKPISPRIGNVLTPPLSRPALRFRELCLELAGLTLEATGRAPDRSEGVQIAKEAINHGRAFAKMFEWIQAQGMKLDVDAIKQNALPATKNVLHTGDTGWIKRIDAEAVGEAVLDLGGGRRTKEDSIDPAVGITFHVSVGTKIQRYSSLFDVYSRSEEAAQSAKERILAGIAVSPEPVPEPPLILEVF